MFESWIGYILSKTITQMCRKCHAFSHIGFGEEKNDDYSCPSSFVTSLQLSTVGTMPESSGINFVYSRRRRGNTGSKAVYSAHALAREKRSGEECVSVVSSYAPSVKDQRVVSQGRHIVEDPVIPLIPQKVESRIFKSESINGCLLVEERVFDQASKNTRQKIIEVESINDSCSSSRSDVELASTSMHTEVEDTSECSSSSAMVIEALGEDLSEKDLCVFTHGRQGVWPGRTHGSVAVNCDSGATRNCRPCKICARPESPIKMLICDNCEEAFHLFCCNPRVKKIPQDEWYCHSCSKKRKILVDTISRRFSNMVGENGRFGSSCTGESNPIALMLSDAGPYTTGVRIGKGFQAEVPDWSGSIIKAPLFEVQTDDWDCFCSVLWDPFHADCAVPQELDTDQVVKQLKYIQMLKPRLSTRRRKLDQKTNDNDSRENLENERNVRTRQ
ncbi:uncharacterized protein LOC126669536 isoform X2 [Mercurialis annua]|uniref:uncharacterized protein LOC126669536 isoform X2 n=1 Tax=Mercurialis annua TaxID=3986 RepID=UPI0024AD4245|nr:uncharacterized protein LOC126669536 isoform X2 [Mercurialis annua]